MMLLELFSFDCLKNAAPAGAHREFRLFSTISRKCRNRGRAGCHAGRLARLRFSPRYTAWIGFCALTLTGPALARDAVPQSGPPATRIEVDQQDHLIRFIIDGEERAVLGADGLHVTDDLTYGGRIDDVGRAPAADPGGADEK